jgi:hypothetical protein
MALYLFIVGRGLWIAANARDTYSRLLAGSISMTLFVYRDGQRRDDLGPVARGRRADAAHFPTAAPRR